MALEEYKRKRDFKQTPEPPPKVERGKGHRFAVQKHRASHLHYDFRLEMDGVLKSWAIPKGPSLDPADKRLAMQVEDHPVSYFDFEGIIPPDNYGAGTVMVWDVGTWEPEGEAHAMMGKGDFKFRLDGEKLKGSFALIHIRSRKPGNKGTEWLLIKHRDTHVQEPYDIDEYDYSVLTKRTLDQIAADAGSAEWESNRKASGGSVPKKNDWLADSIAKADAAKRKTAVSAAKAAAPSTKAGKTATPAKTRTPSKAAKTAKPSSKVAAKSAPPAVAGGVKKNSKAQRRLKK
jgi:bifunctional non-homologous end joining protein LigD